MADRERNRSVRDAHDRVARRRLPCGNTGEQRDRSARRHLRRKILGQQHRSDHFGVERFGRRIVIEFGDGHIVMCRCGTHDVVDGPEFSGGRGDRLLVGDVQRDPACVAKLCSRLLCGIDVTRADDHRRSGGVGSACDRQTEILGTSDDEDCGAGQVCAHGVVPSDR